jgi:hypothetical protein
MINVVSFLDAAGLGNGPGEPGCNTQFLNILARIQL